MRTVDWAQSRLTRARRSRFRATRCPDPSLALCTQSQMSPVTTGPPFSSQVRMGGGGGSLQGAP